MSKPDFQPGQRRRVISSASRYMSEPVPPLGAIVRIVNVIAMHSGDEGGWRAEVSELQLVWGNPRFENRVDEANAAVFLSASLSEEEFVVGQRRRVIADASKVISAPTPPVGTVVVVEHIGTNIHTGKQLVLKLGWEGGPSLLSVSEADVLSVPLMFEGLGPPAKPAAAGDSLTIGARPAAVSSAIEAYAAKVEIEISQKMAAENKQLAELKEERDAWKTAVLALLPEEKRDGRNDPESVARELQGTIDFLKIDRRDRDRLQALNVKLEKHQEEMVRELETLQSSNLVYAGRLAEAEAELGRALAAQESPDCERRELPLEHEALTKKMRVGLDDKGITVFATVGLYPDGTPGKLSLTASKEGTTISGMLDAFGEAVSLALQYGVPLETLVAQFSHMRFEPDGQTGDPETPVAHSIVDYLFRWLGKRFVREGV